MAGTSNVLLALGIVLLILGATGLVYGQLQLQDRQSDDHGLLVSVGWTAHSGGGDATDAQRFRTLRFGGLVLGGVGAVLTLSGGHVE